MTVTVMMATKVKRWCQHTWPVSTLNRAETWRKAWAQFGGANLGLTEFKRHVKAAGYEPVKIGECHILRFPGPPKPPQQFMTCTGVLDRG